MYFRLLKCQNIHAAQYKLSMTGGADTHMKPNDFLKPGGEMSTIVYSSL